MYISYQKRQTTASNDFLKYSRTLLNVSHSYHSKKNTQAPIPAPYSPVSQSACSSNAHNNQLFTIWPIVSSFTSLTPSVFN